MTISRTMTAKVVETHTSAPSSQNRLQSTNLFACRTTFTSPYSQTLWRKAM